MSEKEKLCLSMMLMHSVKTLLKKEKSTIREDDAHEFRENSA